VTREPCAAWQPHLVRAGDGSLDAAGQRELAAHVAGCAACREALDEQALAHAALAARPVTRASAGFADRVAAEIARDGWFDVFDFRRLTWRLAPVAAATAVAAYVVVVLHGVPVDTTANATDTADIPVSTALMSDSVAGRDLMPLMLFADPDESLSSALQETTR
jgi:anti-sigma factor RsiW